MKMFKGMAVEHIQSFHHRPTIVMLHDSLGCITLWRDFPQKLAEATGCNLLIYDRLGYGASLPMETFERPLNYLENEADVLNELLIELNIDDAILFGHSDGGSIALIAASRYPKRMKAVIAEAAHIFVEQLTIDGIVRAKVQYETTDLPQRLTKYHGDKTDTIFKAWTETWLREDFTSWNIEYLLPNIQCSLLFIQGEKDEYGTLRQLEETVSQVGGSAHACIIKCVGHTPHKEAKDQTLTASKDFINDLIDPEQ